MLTKDPERSDGELVRVFEELHWVEITGRISGANDGLTFGSSQGGGLSS